MNRYRLTARHRTATLLAGCIAVAGCQPSLPAEDARGAPADATTASDARPANARAQSQPTATQPPTAGTAVGNEPADAPPVSPAPVDASLLEPRTPPEASSPQAAATIVETYFGLIDEKATARADALWRDAAAASAFRDELARLGMPRIEVDAPGDVEGAAGSMYVTVPVRFQPTSVPGNSRPRHGEVVLRRANDVPGSTAEQRRWRIERIDVAMTPK